MKQRQGPDWLMGLAMLVGLGGLGGVLAYGALVDPHQADAPAIRDGSGSYAFTQTRRDGTTPVGWNPCRTIRIEINPQGAPEGHEEMVRTAMRHITEASGLEFDLIGETSSRRFLDEEPSASWDPVLVAWSSEDEYDELEGDIAGVGGATMVTYSGIRRYVTGSVVLDIDAFDQILDAGLEEEAQAIVDHEFGHLVGLDHVKDPGELMYAENTGRTTWGPGDLEGLARLGGIRCT